MILLDTNVVSEAMRPAPNDAVLGWLDQQAEETLYISSITIAELAFGIGVLPEGRRKSGLAAAMDRAVGIFASRVLSFDADAAQHYARLAVLARSAGKGFPTPDGYIAAIAAAHGMAIASRDVGPFDAVGLPVIDPWRWSGA